MVIYGLNNTLITGTEFNSAIHILYILASFRIESHQNYQPGKHSIFCYLFSLNKRTPPTSSIDPRVLIDNYLSAGTQTKLVPPQYVERTSVRNLILYLCPLQGHFNIDS